MTTAPPRPRRTVRELIEAKDCDFMASARRTVEIIRSDLERLATLPEGHPDLEGESSAEIRRLLERSYQAPAAPRAEPPRRAVGGGDLKPSSRGNPCPVCGRSKDGDCRTGSELVICHYGSTHQPPAGLRPGDVIDGSDGQRWAYTGDTSDGRAATFALDKPRHAGQQPRRATPPRQAPPATAPQPAPIRGALELARLPQACKVPPNHLPNGQRITYSPSQTVVVQAGPDGKRHIPHHIGADGREAAGAGPKPWPLWREAEALEHGPGHWIAEAEGEKCGAWLRAGGLVAVSQPGHDHTPRSIERRYRRLQAAGVAGVLYLADNDPTGQAKGERCAAAAAAAGLPLLVVPAAEVWPGLPMGGSIDDAPGTAAERVAALVGAIRAALEQQQQQQGQAGATASQLAAPAPAGGGDGATGLSWLLDRLDTGTGPAGARKTTAGDLAQTLLLVAGDRLRFNQMRLLPEIDGQPIEGHTTDTLHVELQLRGMNITAEAAVDGLATAALQRPYHPVREYLDRVAADPAIEPLDLTALVGQFLRPGDPAGTLQGRMLAKTIIGAVARAYKPGCKLDTCCVLVGEQGAQKSTFWESLAGPDFYSCSSLGNLDKDSLLLVHSTWFLEAAELECVTGKKAAGELKGFLSTAVDHFRVPYGRTIQRRPRPSVLVGTSNRDDFLSDTTGSRRFWIIPITANEIDVEGVRAIRDRIWKTAVIAYRQGQRWWLDRADAAASEIENQQFTAGHPWEGPLGDWLGGWGRTPFTSAEALVRAGLRQKDQIQRRDEMSLATVLAGMGWVQRRVQECGSRKRMWFPDGYPPLPNLPNLPNLENQQVGQRDQLQRSGSQGNARPAQPKTSDLPEGVPVGGTGTERGEGMKKGRARLGSSQEASPRSRSGCPTSPAEVGQRLGSGPEVGHEVGQQAPSTVRDWAEAACEAMKLAPHPAQLETVAGWLQQHPDAPAITKVQLSAALERLHREEVQAEQPDLLALEADR